MRGCWIGCCLLLALRPAAAGEASAFDMSMEQLLDLKITIASRNAQSPLDAPSTVTVVTRSELDALGIRTLEELADYVPGLRAYRWVSNSNQGHTFAPRGLPVPSSNGILFLFDGHRLNVEQTGGPVFSRFISLAAVERVEIIRGPGSALYGSNAFQAVINLITDGGANVLAAEAGSANGRHATLRHRRDFGDVQLALTFDHHADDGERYDDAFDPAHPLQPTTTRDPWRADEAVATVQWRDWRLLWREAHSRSEDFYLLGGLAPEGGFGETHDRLLSVGNDGLAFGDAWHGSVRVDFQRGENDSLGQLVPQGAPPFDAAPWMAGTRVTFEHWEVGTDWRWDISPDSRLNAGATFRYVPEPFAFIRSNYTNRLPPVYLGRVQTLDEAGGGEFLTPVSRRTRGVYLQYQREFAERWQASIGIRHDSYSDVGSATTPRAAVIWTTPWQDRIKLMYGRAFRAPTYSELYFRNNPVQLGNPELDPPRIATFELGYVHGGARTNWSATAFDNRIEDFISRRQLPSGQVQTINIGSVRTRGLELEGQWQFADAWRGRLTWTRLFDQGQSFTADAVTSEIAAQTPAQWGSLALIYERAQWQFGASALHTGRTPLLASQHGYWRGNLHARWRANDALDFTLRITNAGDEEYDTIADDTGLGRDANRMIVRNVPNRGRFVWVGAEWRY